MQNSLSSAKKPAGFGRKKILIIIVIAVVAVVAAGWGAWYWWTGTPEYSMGQLRKGFQTHDVSLALKYIDVDSVFNNFWVEVEKKMNDAATDTSDGWGQLGALLGRQMAESMKPQMRTQFQTALEDSIKQEGDATDENLASGITDKKLQLSKEGGSVMLTLPNDLQVVFTRKPDGRYWVVTEIRGFQLKENSSSTSKSTSQNIIDKKVGDEIELATIKFTVISSEEKGKLTASYFEPLLPNENAKFVVVKASVTNITNSPLSLPNDVFHLIDDQGREYKPTADAMFYVESIGYDELAPSIKKTGTWVFEIPNDSTGYSLNVAKSGTDEVYKVNL